MELKSFGEIFESGMSKFLNKGDNDTTGSRRKQALYEKQAALKNTISFYKEFGSDESTQALMKQEMQEFMKVLADIKTLLDEEANAAIEEK